MFDWVRGLFGSTKAATVQFSSPFLRAPLMPITMQSLVQEGYKRNSAVFACLRTHASAFPEPPMIVKRKTSRGWEAQETHPLTKLMQRPNPFMGQAEFWAMAITWMGIGGNCYVLKRRSSAGRVVELWPLHDAQMRPRLNSTRFITAYEVATADNKWDPVPVEDVIQLRWAPDPEQPQFGLGPIAAIAREVDTDNEAAKYIHSLLRNDATPRTIITVKGQLDDIPYKRFKEQFRERYGGARRGDVMLIEGGEMTVQRIGLNLNELADAALRNVPETRISAAYEVPAILAGLGAGLASATYSNAETLTEYYTERTLIPRWVLTQDQFQALLLPEFGSSDNLRVEFDLSKVRALSEDEDKKWSRLGTALGQAGITLNEYRLGLGYATVPGGDVFYRPSSITVVDATKTLEEQQQAAMQAQQALAGGGQPALPPGQEPEAGDGDTVIPGAEIVPDDQQKIAAISEAVRSLRGSLALKAG